MTEDILPHTYRRVYRESSIQMATFLGGPVVGGYMIAQNFKAFDQHGKVQVTWFFACFITLVGIALVFLLPLFLYFLAQAVVSAYFLTFYQYEFIRDHIKHGGTLHSVRRSLRIALKGLCISPGILRIAVYWTIQLG